MPLCRVLVVLVALLMPWPSPAGADHVREGDVRWKVTCKYSHSLPDDPIVFPDRPGAAHLHDFTGNTAADASTDTVEELRFVGATTTCNDPGDLAAYWTPALYRDGVQVQPKRMTGYYRRGEKHGDIEPYPDGLRIVAGAPATGVSGWKCAEAQQMAPTVPRSCPSGEATAEIRFPDCSDGRIDSADHRSHMAYSLAGGPDGSKACPATHPVQVPELTMFVTYPLNGGRGVTLSSGAQSTLHGDFLNAWEPGRLAERVEVCLNGLLRCPSGGGG